MVVFDNKGRRVQVNNAIVPCEACISGKGRDYSGRSVFIETVHAGGSRRLWGPAPRE